MLVKAIEKLTSCLHPINISKKTILIAPDKKDTNVYFIEKGIARAYNLVEGKEVTSWFSKEGDLIYSTNSFYGKTPGYENEAVQVLENSLFYYIPIAKLETCVQVMPTLLIGCAYCTKSVWSRWERRLIYRLYMSAEERYKDFVEKNPDLIQRVNLGYIASYLGMSHVTLCALRK